MSGPPILLLHHVTPDNAAEFRERLGESLPNVAVEHAETPDESRAAIADAEVVATFRLDEDLVERAAALEWVQAFSAGVDSYPLDALRERGVALTNASGVHAEPLGEQVLGYMLAFERGIHTGVRQQGRGVWERYTGGELAGKTVGVVGVGAIGRRVAELCHAFGMDVLGLKRDTNEPVDVVDELFGPDGLDEVCLRSDYLVLACPLTDETRGMVGTDELRLLGEDGVLVNVARGEVVVEHALVRALQYDAIRGAGLDVFEQEPLPPDSELWDLSNAVVTPHMGGSTPRYVERCADLLAENYAAYVDDGPDGLDNRVL